MTPEPKPTERNEQERTYHLLFFHGSRLDNWKDIKAASYFDAVEKALQHPSDGPVELWLDNRKLAQLRPRSHF